MFLHGEGKQGHGNQGHLQLVVRKRADGNWKVFFLKKWPKWSNLIVEDEQVDCWCTCPNDVNKMLLKYAKNRLEALLEDTRRADQRSCK